MPGKQRPLYPYSGRSCRAIRTILSTFRTIGSFLRWREIAPACASSGLGRLMTERLLARGDRVVATARREDSLADLQREHGERLDVLVLDLTDTAVVRAVLAGAFGQLGRIDMLVSNAGSGLFGAAEEVTDSQIDHQIATNLIGSIQFIRAAIPHLRQQGGELFKSHPKAAKSHTRTSACITQPNGVSRLHRIRCSGSRPLRNRLHYRRTRSDRH